MRRFWLVVLSVIVPLIPATLAAQGASTNVVNIRDYGATGNGTVDDSAAIQAAINTLKNKGGIVLLPRPSVAYLVSTALDLTSDRITNRNGISLIGQGTNTFGSYGSPIYCNTGGVCIDLTGSSFVKLERLGLLAPSGLATPSTIAVLMSRSSGSNFSQFNHIDSVVIYMDSSPGATARGRIALYNNESEHFYMTNSHFMADLPIALAANNPLGIKSPYQGALYSNTSMSVITIVTSAFRAQSRFSPMELWDVLNLRVYNAFWNRHTADGATADSSITINGTTDYKNYNLLITGQSEDTPAFLTLNSSVLGMDIDVLAGQKVSPLIKFGAANLTIAGSSIRLTQEYVVPTATLFQNPARANIVGTTLDTTRNAGINASNVMLKGVRIVDGLKTPTTTVAPGSTYIVQTPAGTGINGTPQISGTTRITGSPSGSAASPLTVGGTMTATADGQSMFVIRDSADAPQFGTDGHSVDVVAGLRLTPGAYTKRGGGTIANAYGIHITGDPTIGTRNYGLRNDGTTYLGGATTFAAHAFASLGAPSDGTIVFCSDCDPGTNVTCTSARAKTGALAFRVNGAWKCIG